MTKPSQSGFKRFFYNQNIKRDKSGKKYKNLIDHAIILVKRLDKEGNTTWLLNAVDKAGKKIHAYGLALHQFETALQHKKLDHLIALFHQTFANKIKTKATQATTPAPQKASVKKITKEETSTEKKKTATKKISDPETTKAPKKTSTTKKVAPKKEAKTSPEKKTTVKKTTKTPSKTTKKSA